MLTPAESQPTGRRDFLVSQMGGVAGLALAWLLREERLRAAPRRPDLAPPAFDLRAKTPAHPPRAKAMISLWMQGGPSHLDLFDPKPALDKLDGKSFPGEIKYDNAAQASSKVMASPWSFRPAGECGMEVSELVPHFARITDDVCLIRSMHTGVNNHGQSIRAMNNGTVIPGQPSLGSWFTYGLGTESQELPAFLALTDPGQLPVLGVENWSNGYLPALYQGTVVRPREPRILNLAPPAGFRGEAQRRYLSLLQTLNGQHLRRHPGELDLEARIASFELAARMQTSAREALDLSQETAETHRLYGLDKKETADFGARCLIARRLVERGVRFVQVYTQNQFWDHHGRIRSALPNACKKVDQPSAALVADLKRRGLLAETLVHWGGEMGRLPVIQNDAGAAKVGRDHNTYGFSMWLAGGGVKGGCIHGSTDEMGHRAEQDPVSHSDYHTTLMHLFGLDPDSMEFEHNGRRHRLVEANKGRVVHPILV